MVERYHASISRMRNGDILGKGPHYLGHCNEAEGTKFADLSDRRYPIMLLPKDGGFDVYLVGDPSYTHEKLSMLVVEKTRWFRRDYATVVGIERLEEILLGSVQWTASPRTPVSVTKSGKVKQRDFTPGTALKEPDCLIHSGQVIPARSQTNFCAIEVAYRNEDVDVLMFEARLWTQQGSTPDGQRRRKALNFIGIHVGPKRPNGHAFGVFICPAQAAAPARATIYTFNASEEYKATWEAATRKANLGVETMTYTDQAVQIKYNFLCPLLKQVHQFDELALQITYADLEGAIVAAERLEDNQATPPVEADMQALFASLLS